MFAGERINNTENRAVKHWLLRAPRNAADPDSGAVHETLDAMLAYAEQVRADAAITDVVNIGIGGSDLGPQMAWPRCGAGHARQALPLRLQRRRPRTRRGAARPGRRRARCSWSPPRPSRRWRR
jgi:hypothetical protein